MRAKALSGWWGLVGGGGDGWSSILVLTSEWSTMILPTKMRLIIVILLLLSFSFTSLSLLSLLLSLSFTLSWSLPLSSLLLLFQRTEWLPENQRRLATPPVNRHTRAPWRDSEDQASNDFEDRLVRRGGGDARRGIPAGGRSDEGDVVQRDDIWWFLGGYQGHAIDFDQYQESETRRSSYPWLLSWHVSPDVSSNCWIEYNRRIE